MWLVILLSMYLQVIWHWQLLTLVWMATSLVRQYSLTTNQLHLVDILVSWMQVRQFLLLMLLVHLVFQPMAPWSCKVVWTSLQALISNLDTRLLRVTGLSTPLLR